MDRSNFNCPACNHDRYHARFPIDGRHMICCARCESEMIWPLPTDEQLSEYYSTKTEYNERGNAEATRYKNGLTNWHNDTATYAQGLFEKGFSRSSTWVEIGCSYGFRAIEMRKLGFDAWGAEYSKEAVDFINSEGGQGYLGSILDDDIPFQHVDLFYSESALEHMRDPYAVLRRMYELLVPGGKAFISVPNWACLTARMNQQKWKWLATPDHIHYFRPAVLSAVLTSMGFRIERVEVTAYDYEIDEVCDALDVPTDVRDATVKKIVGFILSKAWLGDQIHLTIVKPMMGDMAATKALT